MSLFGGNNSSPFGGNNSTGLFGQSSQQSGLFGPPSPSNNSGLFGNNGFANNNSNGFNNNSSAGGGLFSNNNMNNGFGQADNKGLFGAPQNGLFGPPNGGFNAGNTSPLGGPASPFSSPAPYPQSPPSGQVGRLLLHAALDDRVDIGAHHHRLGQLERVTEDLAFQADGLMSDHERRLQRVEAMLAEILRNQNLNMKHVF